MKDINYYLKNISNKPFSLQISNRFPVGAFRLEGFYSPQTTKLPPRNFILATPVRQWILKTLHEDMTMDSGTA